MFHVKSRKKILINGSSRVNWIMERVRKPSTIIRPVYKLVNLSTTNLSRLINLSCLIILEFTNLDPNNPLKKKNNNLTIAKQTHQHELTYTTKHSKSQPVHYLIARAQLINPNENVLVIKST